MKSLWFAGAALVMFGLGCASGSPSGPGVDDADVDASADAAPTTTSDAAPAADAARSDQVTPPAADIAKCRTPHNTLVNQSAGKSMARSDERNLAGVGITLQHYPGIDLLTEADGKEHVNVPEGKKTWIRF